jgi:hypothetical protein
MTGMRRIVVGVGLLTWLFCWSVLHGASAFFTPEGIPEWVSVLLFLPLLLTIGAVVTGLMRLPVWPWLAVAGALTVVVAVIGVQLAELRTTAQAMANLGQHPRPVTVWLAVQTQLKQGVVQALFLVAAPIILAGTGITAWLSGPRRLFAPEVPDGA